MRIVSGRFRRRKLESNPGRTTRPITDRVKEILFERLWGELNGERVADVFAGTGTIGLEALSRGASSVVFLERDHAAFELLERNVSKLGVGDCTLCWRVDVLRSSFRPKGVDHLLPYDIVFFDPPYRMVSDLKPGTRSRLFASLERLGRDTVTSPEAELIFRTPVGADFELPACWVPQNDMRLSTMEIHIFKKVPESVSDSQQLQEA